MPARLLFVSDMTGELNWGRAASLALQQSLAQRFADIQSIPGRYAPTPVVIDTILPPSFASRLLARRDRNVLLRAYYHFEKTFGMHPDYIDADPRKSLQNILRNTGRDGIRELYTAVRDADIVVVDGDGDLIFRTPPARIPLFNLAVIELAAHLGKKVHYVNSIFADCSRTGRNEQFLRFAVSTLSKCTGIAFRDPASMRLAQSIAPELQAQLIPDSLFLWYDCLQEAADNLPKNGDFIIPFPLERPALFGRIRFDQPYICISGGSRAAVSQKEAAEAYTHLATTIRDRFPMNVYLAPTCRGDHFMYEVARRTSLPIIPSEIPIMTAAAIVAQARVYITGRYHPAIMASLGGTPCVFLEADSHKTSSLQELLQYEVVKAFPALPTPADSCQIAQLATDLLQLGGDLRARIQRAARDRAREAQRVNDLIAQESYP